MEKLQKLLDCSNFDSKNILNRSDKVIPQKYLDLIESEGATSELLEELDVPVFKYKTQITIHGLFPELKQNWFDHYKNLFQNKNKSIGVKYNAVDGAKKKAIYSILQHNGWTVHKNSTEWYAYQMESVVKETYPAQVAKFKELLEKIDKSLFYGNIQLYLKQSMFGVYLSAELEINAIAESNVEKLIVNITGKSIAQNLDEIADEIAAREARYEAQRAEREAERKRINELCAPYLAEAKELIKNSGYIFSQNIPLTNDLIVLAKASCNHETFKITYTFNRYSKEKQQKQFRVQATVTDDLNNVVFENSDRWNERKVDVKSVSGWVKQVTKQIETISEPVKVGAVEIVDYSEKAIAVIGETKPVKDLLKSLGGSFNFRLSCGPGWIFPKSKKDELIKSLGL